MYQEFALIYDAVMSEIPYDRWFEKLHACIGDMERKPDMCVSWDVGRARCPDVFQRPATRSQA